MAAAALLLLGVTGCAGDEDPIRIGLLTDCQGPFRAYEEVELSGAELPLVRRGARLVGVTPTAGVTPAVVAGRKVELVRGCSELGEHAVFIEEARRLVEQEHVDAVVGGASIAAREVARLYPDVPFLATFWEEQETTLRRPAPNLYRFTADFGQQAAGLGAYAYNQLGWRHASIVAGNQPAGWGGAAAFVAEFCALGGTIDTQVYRSPYPPENDASVAARVVASGSDGVASFLTPFDSATTVVGELLKRLDDPSRRLLLWDQQLEDSTFLSTLGAKLDGVALTSRFRSGAPSKALADYQARYRAAFPRIPAGFEQWSLVVGYADSVEALLTALERADGDLSDGRARLREELARIRLVLPRGDVHLDANRQVVTDVPLVRLRRRGGATVTEPISIANDVEQTFAGLLSQAPPPGPRSQPCRKTTPPPWARPGAISRRVSR